jgi:hypothetical protein
LRVVSTELRQVFKAYTKQLRQAPAKDGKESTEAVQYRRGFEKVDLSAEARALAASFRSAKQSEDLDRGADEQGESAEQEKAE